MNAIFFVVGLFLLFWLLRFLKHRVEKTLTPRQRLLVVLPLALLFSVPGLAALVLELENIGPNVSMYLFPGLLSVGVGAAFWAWGGAHTIAVIVATLGGILPILKPLFFPLHGEQDCPFGEPYCAPVIGPLDWDKVVNDAYYIPGFLLIMMTILMVVKARHESKMSTVQTSE